MNTRKQRSNKEETKQEEEEEETKCTGKYPERYIIHNTKTSKQEQNVLHPYLIFPLRLCCHKKTFHNSSFSRICITG